MLDALNTITKLINSPPGQLVAGGVLAGIPWFFKRVEALYASIGWTTCSRLHRSWRSQM